MLMLTDLQLSWLPAPSRRRTVRPDHDPAPLPAGTTMAPVPAPPMAKSFCVHAGLVLSVCTEKVRTTAVTELMWTGCAFGLSNVPDSGAAGPPGQRAVGAPAWVAVVGRGVPAV